MNDEQRPTKRVTESYEPHPRPARARAGAWFYALQAFVWVCVVVPAALRLHDPGSARWVDVIFVVVGSSFLIGMLVMTGISYRAGRRGWMHPRQG